MFITITGKSGSGKSTIAEYLVSLDNRFIHLDIDKVGHLVLEDLDIRKKVAEVFPIAVCENFKIDRKKLGSIVFQDEVKMDVYSSITWPKMEEIIDSFLYSNRDKIVILDWILIPKTKYFLESDMNILVAANSDIRYIRASNRDKISKDKFEEREQASVNYDGLNFDFLVENKDIEKTKGLVRTIYEKSTIPRKF